MNFDNLCVIFDMDGTLADTTKITIPAINKAANEMKKAPPPDNLIKSTIGVGGIEFYAAFYPNDDEQFLKEFSEKVESYEREITSTLKEELLFEGVENLLKNLIQKGAICAIASTGDEIHVNSVLKNAGIFSYFTAMEVGNNNKYEEIFKIKNKFQNYNFIMIGDKPKDSNGAKENDIPSIGAGYGFSNTNELSGFDKVAYSIKEILELIYSL